MLDIEKPHDPAEVVRSQRIKFVILSRLLARARREQREAITSMRPQPVIDLINDTVKYFEHDLAVLGACERPRAPVARVTQQA